MSTITHTVKEIGRGTFLHDWSALATGDDGLPARLAQAADRTVQIEGTFGGATCTIQGSLNGSNWHTLKDMQGNDLIFTAAGIAAVMEATIYTRPVVTGGAGASINVTLLSRSSS